MKWPQGLTTTAGATSPPPPSLRPLLSITSKAFYLHLQGNWWCPHRAICCQILSSIFLQSNNWAATPKPSNIIQVSRIQTRQEMHRRHLLKKLEVKDVIKKMNIFFPNEFNATVGGCCQLWDRTKPQLPREELLQTSCLYVTQGGGGGGIWSSCNPNFMSAAAVWLISLTKSTFSSPFQIVNFLSWYKAEASARQSQISNFSISWWQLFCLLPPPRPLSVANLRRGQKARFWFTAV